MGARSFLQKEDACDLLSRMSLEDEPNRSMEEHEQERMMKGKR